MAGTNFTKPCTKTLADLCSSADLVAGLDVIDNEFEVAVGLVDARHRHDGVVCRRARVLPGVGRGCCYRGRRQGVEPAIAGTRRPWFGGLGTSISIVYCS